MNPEEATADLCQPGFQLPEHYGRTVTAFGPARHQASPRGNFCSPVHPPAAGHCDVSLPSVLAPAKVHRAPRFLTYSLATSFQADLPASAHIFTNRNIASAQRLNQDDYQQN